MNDLPLSWASMAHKKRVTKMGKRLLRTYRRVAYICHSQCYKCGQEILPGDEYEAEVYVVKNPPWSPKKKSVIDVWKNHICCPEDPWDDERRNESQDITEYNQMSNVA